MKFKTALDIVQDQAARDSLNNAARDVVKQTNFNVTNLKKNRVGNKKPHFWDIENFNATYAYTIQEQHNRTDLVHFCDDSAPGTSDFPGTGCVLHGIMHSV